MNQHPNFDGFLQELQADISMTSPQVTPTRINDGTAYGGTLIFSAEAARTLAVELLSVQAIDAHGDVIRFAATAALMSSIGLSPAHMPTATKERIATIAGADGGLLATDDDGRPYHLTPLAGDLPTQRDMGNDLRGEDEEEPNHAKAAASPSTLHLQDIIANLQHDMGGRAGRRQRRQRQSGRQGRQRRPPGRSWRQRRRPRGRRRPWPQGPRKRQRRRRQRAT